MTHTYIPLSRIGTVIVTKPPIADIMHGSIQNGGGWKAYNDRIETVLRPLPPHILIVFSYLLLGFLSILQVAHCFSHKV